MDLRSLLSLRTDVEAEAAQRAGTVSSLIFAALLTLGIGLHYATGENINAPASDRDAYYYAAWGYVLEVMVPICTAWRLRQRKGLVIGCVNLLLFTIELSAKLLAGAYLWLIVYAAILSGLIKGVRASAFFKSRPAFQASDAKSSSPR